MNGLAALFPAHHHWQFAARGCRSGKKSTFDFRGILGRCDSVLARHDVISHYVLPAGDPGKMWAGGSLKVEPLVLHVEAPWTQA